MEQETNVTSKRIKIIIAGVVIFVLAVVAISVSFIIINNYVPVVIRNLDDYMGSISNKDKRLLQNSFGTFVKEKFDTETLPTDIFIRDDTYTEKEADEFKVGDFIVDIDSLKISYQVSFAYPSDKYTSVNPVIDCPDLDKTKYPETSCVGMYNSTDLLKEKQLNPVYSVLPINVNDFDASTGETTRYDIYGFFDYDNGDKFSINIIDYSCNNREKALQAIRDKGFNPDDYTINYQDECFINVMPHNGTNSLGNRYGVSYTVTNEGKLYFLINNYACNNKTATEEATLKAASDWLLSRGITMTNYEYGILTLCARD